LDRGGLVGADGATHHGAYDLAYMRMIPNMVVSAPMDEEDLRNLMFTAQLPDKGPFSIRYPRGNGVMTDWKKPLREITVGTGRKVTTGNDLAILTIGHPGNFAQEAISELNQLGVSVAHYDMRFVKPIDEVMLHEVFSKFKKVITVEDGCLMGGFGSAVIEFMVDQKYSAEVLRLGIADEYIHHGTQEELWEDCGFDKNAIIFNVKKMLSITSFEKKHTEKVS
jgi:1-deoxy-D-xylulose-5-phosphate synthase